MRKQRDGDYMRTTPASAMAISGRGFKTVQGEMVGAASPYISILNRQTGRPEPRPAATTTTDHATLGFARRRTPIERGSSQRHCVYAQR
ncbi:hypothetical protein AAFF_G00329150 [Aldrovandia affinis]|uniref:Uncharacterized protein n=1 Tax=Aldrovandia affinis TaxID=143900 RepID=A0AAD7SLQ3_9TELE|nr:hypothetical protein AAFF_G00329150 [Aldrovandia affinis]